MSGKLHPPTHPVPQLFLLRGQLHGFAERWSVGEGGDKVSLRPVGSQAAVLCSLFSVAFITILPILKRVRFLLIFRQDGEGAVCKLKQAR